MPPASREIDQQIVDFLHEYDLTVDEYFDADQKIQISRLPLPPGTMDAAEFLRTIAFNEESLKLARARLAELESTTQTLQSDPSSELAREVVCDLEKLHLEYEATTSEIDTLFTKLWTLAIHTRIIDGHVFRTRLSNLLNTRLDAVLSHAKAKATLITKDPSSPASEQAPP